MVRSLAKNLLYTHAGETPALPVRVAYQNLSYTLPSVSTPRYGAFPGPAVQANAKARASGLLCLPRCAF